MMWFDKDVAVQTEWKGVTGVLNLRSGSHRQRIVVQILRTEVGRIDQGARFQMTQLVNS
jgi:hypothetical protein